MGCDEMHEQYGHCAYCDAEEEYLREAAAALATHKASGPFVTDEDGGEWFTARSSLVLYSGVVMQPGDAVKHYVKHWGPTDPQHLTALYHEYAEYHRQNR